VEIFTTKKFFAILILVNNGDGFMQFFQLWVVVTGNLSLTRISHLRLISLSHYNRCSSLKWFFMDEGRMMKRKNDPPFGGRLWMSVSG